MKQADLDDLLSLLTPAEAQAIIEFRRVLLDRFGNLVWALVLFGSKARGDDTPTSDIDLLVGVDTDDWKIHKQICYLAVDVGLSHNLFGLSLRIWSSTHLKQMAEIEAGLYDQIQRDGLDLLRSVAALAA